MACGVIFAAFVIIALKVYCKMQASIEEAQKAILAEESEDERKSIISEDEKMKEKLKAVEEQVEIDVNSAVGGFMTDLEPTTEGRSGSGSFGSRPMSLPPAVVEYLNAPDYESPPGSYAYGQSPLSPPEEHSTSGSEFGKFGMAPDDGDDDILKDDFYFFDDNIINRNQSDSSDPFSSSPHLRPSARRASSSPNMMAHTGTDQDGLSLFFNSNSDHSLQSVSTNSWHNLVTGNNSVPS